MLILTESGTDMGLYNASTSLLVPLSAAGEQRFNTPQQSLGLRRKENPFQMRYELEPYKKVIGSLVLHQQVGMELKCKNIDHIGPLALSILSTLSIMLHAKLVPHKPKQPFELTF